MFWSLSPFRGLLTRKPASTAGTYFRSEGPREKRVHVGDAAAMRKAEAMTAKIEEHGKYEGLIPFLRGAAAEVACGGSEEFSQGPMERRKKKKQVRAAEGSIHDCFLCARFLAVTAVASASRIWSHTFSHS